MPRLHAVTETVVHRLPSFVRTRVTAPPGGAAGMLDRVTWLTPYAAEEIAQEAKRAGPGARLEVTVPALTSDDGVAAVESLFGWLRERGVSLVIEREPPGD
jgi:hypothetical protein